MLYFYFLFFSCWLFLNYRKYKFSASSFLISVYALSSLASLFLLYFYKSYDEEKIVFSAVLFHIVCLAFFLVPIVKFGNIDITKFKFPNYKLLTRFAWILIILSFVSIIVSAFKMQVAFSFKDLNEARVLHNLRELHSQSSRNIFTYLGGIGEHLSLFALFMSFYYFIFYPKSKLLILLLFISSFAVVFNNLAIMGRDGIVRWFLFFAFVYFFFKNHLSRRIKKRVLLLFLLGAIPIGVVFYAITVSRFSDRGVFYYLIEYTGQSFIYFSYNFNQFMEGTYGGRMVFPSLFPANEQASINNLNDVFYANYNLNTFSTFVGSFYFDLGLFKTIIIAFLFFFCLMFYFRKSKSYPFSKIIVFVVLYQIFLLGVFYYMFTSTEVINTFILIIAISIYLDFRAKKSKLGRV